MLLAAISVSVVVGSAFAVGLITAKPATDPNSAVIDICGSGTSSSPQVPAVFPCAQATGFCNPGVTCVPPPLTGTTTYAWGLHIPSGPGTFGPAATTLTIAITIIFFNGCPGCPGFMHLDPVTINGLAVGALAASCTSTVAAVFGAAGCSGTMIDLSGIGSGAVTIVASGTTCNTAGNICNSISNGVNLLGISVPGGSEGIGIAAIRAVITI